MAKKKTKPTRAKRDTRNGKDPNGPNVKTLTALAEKLGVGHNTPSRWKSHPDFPVNRDGTYPVGRIRAWVAAMRSRSADRTDSTPGGLHVSKERAAAELEYRQTKTERERLNLERERGDLLERSEIQAQNAELLADLRRNLLVVLPRRIAPRDVKLQAKIRAEVRAFLEAWST